MIAFMVSAAFLNLYFQRFTFLYIIFSSRAPAGSARVTYSDNSNLVFVAIAWSSLSILHWHCYPIFLMLIGQNSIGEKFTMEVWREGGGETSSISIHSSNGVHFKRGPFL